MFLSIENRATVLVVVFPIGFWGKAILPMNRVFHPHPQGERVRVRVINTYYPKDFGSLGFRVVLKAGVSPASHIWE